MKTHRAPLALITLLSGLALSVPALAADPVKDAQQTLALFTKTDPGLKTFLARSSGYVVFPSITKVGIGVGGAHGSGTLFDHAGNPVAKASVTQMTVGAQIGAQGYAEVIVFETPKAFSDFRGGEFPMAAQVSAVALSAGASENAKYRNGVAVFTATTAGLMLEASVGGQKFKVSPLGK